MPRFLAPITVAQEYVTSNETISGSETILGATSGKDSYWTTVNVTSGISADYGSFVNNVSAVYYYGNGSYLTNLNASNITAGTLSTARLPVFNGDISTTLNTTVSTTVQKIQGRSISTATPANGQFLQWNGTAWVPGSIATGGSGGGGVTYYFNYANRAAISPTTGLPTSPVAPSLLGREYSVGEGSLESVNLTQNVYSLVAGFVTLSSEPAVTNIPAGIWDFNIWVDIVGNASVNQTSMQIRVYKYISSTSTYTPLASSEDLYIYDPTVIAQYIASVTMPQTTILSSDRIYIEFWAAKSVNQSLAIRFWFDSSHPSHVHTTIPSVAGSGLVKTVNGVYQTPASLLVDVDVADNAQIAQSKIYGLSNSLAEKFNTTDVIPISAGGTGQATAAAGLSALGGFPISGGTITDGLTATSGTFTSYLSSPSISGTYYGDGTKLIGIVPSFQVDGRITQLTGTLSGNTFTNSVTGALSSVDAYAFAAGDSLLWYFTGTNAGLWTVTSTGSPTNSAVLTRPSYYQGTLPWSLALVGIKRSSIQGTWLQLRPNTTGTYPVVVNTTNMTTATTINPAGNASISGNTFQNTQTMVAGSTTVAPLKFQSGVLQTTPAAHSLEWNGTSLYTTTSASTRTAIPSFIAGPLSATGVVPALSSTSGVAGQMAFDINYLYICISTNTWKRVQLNAW